MYSGNGSLRLSSKETTTVPQNRQTNAPASGVIIIKSPSPIANIVRWRPNAEVSATNDDLEELAKFPNRKHLLHVAFQCKCHGKCECQTGQASEECSLHFFVVYWLVEQVR